MLHYKQYNTIPLTPFLQERKQMFKIWCLYMQADYYAL